MPWWPPFQRRLRAPEGPGFLPSPHPARSDPSLSRFEYLGYGNSRLTIRAKPHGAWGSSSPGAGCRPRPLRQPRDPDALQRSRAARQPSPSCGERRVASFPLLWVWGWRRGRGAQCRVPDRCPRGGGERVCQRIDDLHAGRQSPRPRGRGDPAEAGGRGRSRLRSVLSGWGCGGRAPTPAVLPCL